MVDTNVKVCHYCNSRKIARFRVNYDTMLEYSSPPRGDSGKAVYIYICVSCGRVIFPYKTLETLGFDSVVL